MAGAKGGRSLEETPTWAVAVVCFVLVVVSIIIEHVIHLIGKVKAILEASSAIIQFWFYNCN
jgi:hypothetical protein